jgi:hypothetical protein
MNKLKKTIILLKDNFLNILILGLMFFCLFNIFRKPEDSFTIVANSLAIFLAIFYFINFEKEKIKDITQRLIRRRPLDTIKFLYHKKLNTKHRLSLSFKHYLSNIIRFLYKKRWEITSYLFLFLLLIITLGQLSFLEKFINLSWIKKYQTILTILTIACGGLTFWHNRERIEQETEKENI